MSFVADCERQRKSDSKRSQSIDYRGRPRSVVFRKPRPVVQVRLIGKLNCDKPGEDSAPFELSHDIGRHIGAFLNVHGNDRGEIFGVDEVRIDSEGKPRVVVLNLVLGLHPGGRLWAYGTVVSQESEA